MVASNNLNIFGITVSLAWQLPHKIFEHKEHESQEHRRNDSIKIQTNSLKDYHDIYYNHKHYHDHRINIHPKDNNNNENSKNHWSRASWTKDNYAYSPIYHKVYPALRMRRNILNENKNNINNMHSRVKRSMNYHRISRISLYKSIEKYLNT